MQKSGHSILLSASDVVGHLNCRYLTGLDIAVAEDVTQKPAFWDPLLEILWERGARHERGFIEHLKSQGLSVTIIEGIGVDDKAAVQIRDAMIASIEIIVQGAFRTGVWVVHTDVLRRVETASDLGAWSYATGSANVSRT